MKEKQLARIQGCLIAGAIGDAIGFISEKKPFQEIKHFANTLQATGQYTIPHRTFPRDYLFGQYSDDTQFSKLLVLSHIEQQPYLNYLVPAFNQDKLIGLGKNTRNILKYYSEHPQKKPAFNLINNNSNGALMRSGVIGLLYKNITEIKLHSATHSELTHHSYDSVSACQVLALVMSALIEGKGPSSVLNIVPNDLKTNLLKHMWAHSTEEIRKTFLKTPLAIEWQGIPPLAQETLLAALGSFMRHHQDSLKTLITQTLLLGGDTDSTCAIAAALWGANRGVDSIDLEFRNIIHDKGEYKENYFMDLALYVQNFRNP